MATLSSFFGQAQGSGTQSGVITDPRKLPFFHNLNPVYFKWSDGHNWMGDHTNDFWYYWYSGNTSSYTNQGGLNTQIDDNGTLVDSSTFPRLGADWNQYNSATYAGEYVTIMDHTNEGGYLCYVKGFGAKDAVYSGLADPIVSKVKITVDGTAYEFQCSLRTHNDATATSITYQHPEWGHFGRAAEYATSSYGSKGAGYLGAYYGSHLNRDWFNYDSVDQFGVWDIQGRSTTFLPHSSWFISGELPALRYDNSIKVECAINKYADTVTNGTGSAGQTNHRYTHRAYALRVKDPEVII